MDCLKTRITKAIKSLLLLLLVTLCLCLSLASDAAEKVVTIATLGDYAPLVFVDNNAPLAVRLKPGEYSADVKGFSWEIVRDSFYTMGYTIELIVVPWARALSLLEHGQVDLVFPAGKNTERMARFSYSAEFVNEVSYVIYINADNAITWQGLSSLRNLTIGVKRGFSYGDTWNAFTEVNKYSIGKIAEGFGMLSQGRIDGFLGYETNWDYLLEKHNWQKKYKKLPAFERTLEYMVALKSNTNGNRLLADFDKGKQQLKQSGRLDDLKKKWRVP